MRTGKLASFECTSGWNRIYTVPEGENGIVSVRIVSKDASATTGQLAHVRNGKEGTKARTDADIITGRVSLASEDLVVENLGVQGGDDIYAYDSAGSVAIASVNTTGEEFRRRNKQDRG